MAKHYEINLQDASTRKPISTAGGVAMVVAVGLTSKVAITDVNGVAVANPSALINGKMEFYVADSVNGVDIYGMAPGGQFFKMSDVKVSGQNEIYIDTQQRHQLMRLPFHITDMVAATEYDTGFDLPAKAVVGFLDMLADITIVDATETLDVGTLSTESGGDANAFVTAVSVATLGLVLDTALTAGFLTDAAVAKSISMTLTAGSDTAAGFVQFPYTLID